MILPALSLRQPWAVLAVLGLKDVENRSWRCPDKYIGRQVLIHAGKRPCPWEPGYSRCGLSMPVWQAAQLAYNQTTGKLLSWDTCNPMSPGLDLGGIVGVATIIACKRGGNRPSPWATDGSWWWLLEHARPVPFHSCPGRLGFFEVDYPHDLREAA